MYDNDIADENRKPEAVICQGFDAETVVGGRPVFISLLESIAADDGKGDLTGNISFDVDDGSTRRDFALSFAEKYSKLDAQGVADEYRRNVLAEFYDAVIPIFVKSEATAFWILFCQVSNECNATQVYEKPLVKLCKKLMEAGRALDFHRMVLDIDVRNQLLKEL